jgi:ribosome-binding ATPase YchF (GTP1/OBG family)
VKDEFTPQEYESVRKYNFLSLKPIIYALNVSQDDLVRAQYIEKEFTEKL